MKLGFFGLIGSGKTTAINYLKEKYNFEILDLDEISKIVLAEEKGINFIRTFIPEAYDFKTQEINRSKLRTILFTDQQKNKLFAQVIWPEIGKMTNTILAKSSNKELAIEGALLPVLNLDLDKIVLIETKNETIIQRVSKRDQRDIFETKNLIKIQKSWIKNSHFDDSIKNDSQIKDLYLKIDQLMKKYGIKKVH